MSEATEIVEAQPQRALAAMTPEQMLSVVVQRGAGLDEVERYMALYERWKAERARDAYTGAFAAFKAEAVTIIKNRTVDAGPLQGNSYAELFAVVNAVTPFLSKHGLSAAWKLTKDDKDWIEVTCTVRHTAGHSESVSMGGPPDAGGAKNAIQARASTVSYLERYTIKAILGLAEQNEDDDGATQGNGGDTLLEAGRDASMDGLASLTQWWGGLTAKQRSGLNKEFPTLRRAAVAADKGVSHG